MNGVAHSIMKLFATIFAAILSAAAVIWAVQAHQAKLLREDEKDLMELGKCAESFQTTYELLSARDGRDGPDCDYMFEQHRIQRIADISAIIRKKRLHGEIAESRLAALKTALSRLSYIVEKSYPKRAEWLKKFEVECDTLRSLYL